MEIPFQGNHFDGINNYLFNRKKLDIHKHLICSGFKNAEGGDWGDPIIVFDPLKNSSSKNDNFASESAEERSYIKCQYRYFAILANNYTIRTRTDGLFENYPLSWNVEVSFDGEIWNPIHSIHNTTHLRYNNAYSTYPTNSTKYSSFFRIIMTEKNSGAETYGPNWVLHLSKIEFFGSFVTTLNPFIKLTCFQTKTCNNILFLISIIESSQ